MSYDLHLFRLPEGADPAEFHSHLQQEEEKMALDLEASRPRLPPEEERARMQRLADSLKSSWPAFVQFESERPLPWIELDDENLQVQIMIRADSVSITMPYFRERSAEMLGLTANCIEIVTRETGFVAYDPQLGRLVAKGDTPNMQTQYREMDRHLPEIIQHGKRSSAAKPWWKFW